MYKKKIGKMVLAATMCAALLVGCGNKDKDVSDNDPKQEENTGDITNQPEKDDEEKNQPEENPEEDNSKEEEPGGEEPGEEEPGNDNQEDEAGKDDTEEGKTEEEDNAGGAAVKLYKYGWNGSGVDFSETDIRGWNDNDTTSPMTDESGNSVYHTEDNFGSDAYLVFDFGAGKEIGTIRMSTPNENILADSWAVYAGNQMNNAESSWEVVKVSSEMQLVDGVIEVAVNGTYQYIMIGGYNADEFMNAWVHAWDYMTEIAFVEGIADSGNAEQGDASDVKMYVYGWNGSGVDFSETDIRGWNDNDTTSPMTDGSGNSVYHTEDNFGSDAYLVFDFGAGKEIGTIRMSTPNENILSDSWAVYAGNQMNNAESSWEVVKVSSEMQLVDGVIEVPVNGTYQYIMIGGYNADEFMNAWVHAWDYMTEIAFVEGIADSGNAEQGDASGVKLYKYGWNGSGVDFFETDIRGWNDNDTTSPMADESGNSVYHTEDNFGSDAYLVFDFGAGKEIGTIRMSTPNENILADSWAVYAGNQMNNEEGSWEVVKVSSEMQLVDGVIEVPVNGTYQYIMIGGYNADEFMNAWVHAWDYMTEITFVE